MRDATQAADGVAEEEFVGGAEVGERQDAFFGARDGLQQVTAEDARQYAAGQRRRVEAPLDADKDIADGSLGDLVALVAKENLVEA